MTMKIILYGVQTINKGAELMLYAILRELEKRLPDSVIYLPQSRLPQGPDYLNTTLKIKFWPNEKIIRLLRLKKILKMLHLSRKFVYYLQAVKDADCFIDASGFRFSDQFNISNEGVRFWDYLLKSLHQRGCKIVFLPQAFGPVSLINTKKVLRSLSDNSSIIMPREIVSFNYLKDSGVVDMEKVRVFTDFTSLVDGIFPSRYNHLKGGICIIPNMKMIESGRLSLNRYVNLLSMIINLGQEYSRPVYLLNHEGKKDEDLAWQCKKQTGDKINVITGLNALEVKGLISSAYLVVTSRFHGLASALNCCVPCLATSWSHKYEELYRDFNLNGYLLPLDNTEKVIEMVRNLLDKENNEKMRNYLAIQSPRIKEQTREMWNVVWDIINN